ncbi:MAG: hypothetical protein DDG60_10375 [Anaerolineae bacterium]|nr:MAG: hypothetical protein DDG60_10375 [Anaerolineae bacterium]
MRTIALLVLPLFLFACSPAAGTPVTPPPEPSNTPPATMEPTATPFFVVEEPTATTTVVEQTTQTPPPAPTAPSCTILQDLNLRSGPGTAYRPPILVLPKNSIVTPLGFNPTGIPGGSWVYVEVSPGGQKGWVSAGNQFVSCDINLSSLPSLVVGTPLPPPLPRSAISSTPEGSCADTGLEYVCEVVFSDEGWIQFKILQNGRELGQADGVEQVSFAVIRGENVVYEITELAKDYCIFGGNGPCNPWVVENYTYRWKAGGAAVQPGEYLVSIESTVNGILLTWRATFKITLP